MTSLLRIPNKMELSDDWYYVIVKERQVFLVPPGWMNEIGLHWEEIKKLSEALNHKRAYGESIWFASAAFPGRVCILEVDKEENR